ncbi:Putative SOS response-associated peptidase YedK [Thiohalospira halophila DSM 15071]|uniref:Abasic site processing protein n=1 Tax=Thiohalospira halophila DSM 15071 TaxID=1123397 RepID=A0A1I1N1N1_9GAMM|nr:SOS response-associated peptidase [Thiohalospira halophila]SFC91072.1 Putative SOS response-associated peptidase YedK [Thiohalospira halophila DSM 15071]
MCGRYSRSRPLKVIAQLWLPEALRTVPAKDPGPHYNIPPGVDIPVFRSDEEGRAELAMPRWGFRPRWADESAPKPINARSEKVATSPWFQEAFAHRRCLVPADGWFEWREGPSSKQPYYITLAEEDPDPGMLFAGIWEPTPDGERAVCAILTQPARGPLTQIHPRQPVVLDPESRRDWLDPERVDREAVREAARPLDVERLRSWPVSTRVNRPAHDEPAVREAVEV